MIETKDSKGITLFTIEQTDLDFMKLQKLYSDKDGSFSTNPYLKKLIWDTHLEELNKEGKDKNFFLVWYKKFKDEWRTNIYSIKKDVLTFIATRQEDKASESLVKSILRRDFIYSTADDVKSEMWVYQDGIYTPNGESHIKAICRAILEEAYTPQRANKVIEKIRADTFIKADDFFAMSSNEQEIPVLNGILNIKTKELSPFNPKKIFFSKIPVKYNLEAKCPSIEKFFRDILKDESDSKVMFELIGYCLFRDYPLEKAFMFLGSGRNGKGKTLSLIKKFLGIENCCSVPLSQMKHESSALCELHNKLANLSGDLNNTDLKETGVFKMITGRDLIQARRKFLRDITFVNHSKQIFACNELPRVYDLSEGFWSRWVLLEFPYKFVNQEEYNNTKDKTNLKIEDPQIIEKISTPEELSGLLNICLESLNNLLKRKAFSLTKGTAEIKDLWVRKSDSFTAFCWDCLEEDPEGYISKGELRKEFSKYCKSFKIKGSSDKSIKVTLEDLFGVIESRKGNSFDNQERVWEGIKFKNRQDRHSFSNSIGIGDLTIYENTPTILPILSDFTKEELNQTGLTPQELEEALK